MLRTGNLDPGSSTPLYRQLYLQIKGLIESGDLGNNTRLPATRELAGQLGLNRTTVSAAYELLESEGLITGQVGRGSFVTAASFRTATPPAASTPDWRNILPDGEAPAPASRSQVEISFSASRPSELLFPLEDFRITCGEVISSPEAKTILQLGSPLGYAPLRRYLRDQSQMEGVVNESDDILITSGCQQAFDLLQRTLASQGGTVVLEDPIYPGLKNVFQRPGARVIGIPIGGNGIEVQALEGVLARERPRLLVLTPNFQNPTGATMPLSARKAVLELAQRSGVILIENDIYGPLRYVGESIPTIKSLDASGRTVLLRSFSKLAFPGLRVGWIIAPRILVEKLTAAKQLSDLHTDQLSQAVLLRFAESGRLEDHRKQMLNAGLERLRAALAACEKHLPPGAQFTQPRGGMNLWIRLPGGLDASELLGRAEREGVSYVPGKYFAVSEAQPSALRISFAGLEPEQIRTGIRILGAIFEQELERTRTDSALDVPAMV